MPFKSSTATSAVRVDQAPGFKSLIKKPFNLQDLGIILEPGDVKNKNSLAIVDRKIQELEEELRKISPHSDALSHKNLALATARVNEKIRVEGLSAKERTFSRNQFTDENILLKDKHYSETLQLHRDSNQQYSSKSKAKLQQQVSAAGCRVGHLVFLKRDGNKHNLRELYLVTRVDSSNITESIEKLLHSLSGKYGRLHQLFTELNRLSSKDNNTWSPPQIQRKTLQETPLNRAFLQDES